MVNADAAALDAFYTAAMTLTPEKKALLEANGLLVTADLRLRDKVRALASGTHT